MGVRFAAAPFRWNLRVAVALVPSLIIITSFGGLPAVSVLTAGSIIAYILDALRQREAAFAAVWIALGGTNLTLLLTGAIFPPGRPVALSIIMTAASALTLLMAGVWATLQFKFLQLEYPSLMVSFERMLLGCAMPLGSAIQTWAIVAAVGADHAAFYLAAILGVMYFALSIPLESSFSKVEVAGSAIGGRGPEDENEAFVQRRLDGVVNAALFAGVPYLFYIAVHWSALFKWEHLWSVLALSSAPWCCMATIPGGLWWLTDKQERRQTMRAVVSIPATAVFLAGLEGRLILPAFGEYIRLHPPYNIIAVSAALYGVAFLVLLHVSGALSEAAASTLDGAALMLAAGAGSLAVGVPLVVMPAPLLAAGGLAMFLDSNTMRDYLLFVVGSVGTAIWFVHHHFWFLDVSIGGLPLQAVCQMLLIATIPAALLPGLLYTGAHKDLINQQMLIQGVLVFVMEEILYSGDHPDEISVAYPAFLVVLTTALGVALTEHLATAGKLGILTRWWCNCMYWSKLAMLVVPEARLGVPMLILVQASTPPLLLAGPLGHKSLEPWRGILHSCNVVLAVLLSRFAIFDILAFLSGGRPSEGLVTGALLVAVAVSCMPLVFKFFSHTPGPPRLLALVLAAGLLIAVLQPPLPLKGGARCPQLPLALCPRLWDDRHIPARDEDDAAYYALGLARRLDWPLWLLFGGGMAALGAVATPSTYRGAFSGTRLLLASVAGVAVGSYISLEFFPGLPLLQIAILLGACTVGALLIMLQLPGAASPTWLPTLAAFWALQMPFALALAISITLPELPIEARRLFPDPTHSMDADRMETAGAGVLGVCAAEALLLAFALKLRVAGAAQSPDSGSGSGRGTSSRSKGGGGLGVGSVGYVGSGYSERASDFLGACLPMPASGSSLGSLARLKGSAGPGLVSLIQEGLGWIPTACNVAAVMAFTLALLLNGQMTGSSDASIFALAPILLLLTQDPLVMWGLSDKRRYFPPAVAVTTFLAVSAASQLVADFTAGADSILDEHAREVLYIIRNWGCLAAALPCHVLFARYAWSRTRTSGTILIVVLLAALGSLILTDLQTIQALAAFGMLMCGVQFLAMRRVSEVGRKLI